MLSGEELTLPEAEIRALARAYDPNSVCSLLGKRTVACTISDYDIIKKIEARAAYCRFGGTLVATGDSLRSLTQFNVPPSESRTFAVHSKTIPKSEYGELGGMLKLKTGSKVSLEEPERVFEVEKIFNGYLLAVSEIGYKQFSWRERRPRVRKFFLPSAIYPKLARCLVNLSRCKEGDLFVDPFCGTGSLLIEASIMGMRSIGIDLTKWIARGCQLNLKGFGLDFSSILRADSSRRSFFPLKRVDAVATDVPYGRASSTKGKSTGEIARGFMSAISGSMGHSKYCVVMHPSDVDLEYDPGEFVQEEQHLLYVHRNLTRAITVLRKI